MKYRTLGRTGLKVSEVGFGAWGIGKTMWKGSQDGESIRALHTAINRGVNFIDTALVYGNGHSEKLIGQVLQDRDERVYVATKVPPKNYKWPSSGSLSQTFPRDHIIKCLERSLDNLQLEKIDLVQLHVWSSEWLSEDEWYSTLCELRDLGAVSYIGVSVDDHEPDSALELVRSGKIDTVQVIFNIFDQSPTDHLFSTCLELDVGVIVRVPFDEGSLTGGIAPSTVFPKGDWRNLYFAGSRKQQVYDRVNHLLPLLGQEVESLSDQALKFCLYPNAVSTVIPGMRNVKHVIANTAVSDTPALSSRLIEKLKVHRWDRNFYPPS